jgi:hypothetical protein
MELKLDSENGVIKCYSDSGSVYEITKGKCTCKGYAFRGTCKHYVSAQADGWLDKLTISLSKPSFQSFRSPMIIQMRKNAISEFLKKNSIKPNAKIIDFLEKKVTMSMKPKQFLTLAKGYKSFHCIT